MKICFIGGIFQDTNEYFEKNKGFNQIAADNFQKMILSCLKNDGVDMISAPFVGSFPDNYNDRYTKNDLFNFKGIKVQQIKNNNLKIIYLVSRLYYLLRTRISTKEIYDIDIIYSVHTPFLISNFVTKIFKKTRKTVLIVPDLPQYMNLETNRKEIYKIMKRLEILLIKILLKKIDGFILLTENMNEKINKNKKPNIIIESIIDLNNSQFEKKINDEKIVTYTGTLNYKYGIKKIIEFLNNNKNAKINFIVCGSGEAHEELVALSKKDARMNYLGVVNKEDLIAIQKKSDFLINPRENNEEYTKYSFPSKITEYLQSGKPIICYRLDGIPNEYKDILYYIDEVNDKELENFIINYSISDLINYQKKLLEFVKTKKSESIKRNEIVLFLNEVRGVKN